MCEVLAKPKKKNQCLLDCRENDNNSRVLKARAVGNDGRVATFLDLIIPKEG